MYYLLYNNQIKSHLLLSAKRNIIKRGKFYEQESFIKYSTNIE